MPVHQITVQEAVSAHRAAVLVDEKSFHENGTPISDDQSEITGAAERAAFKAFCEAPCHTATDVQLKVAYVLDGTVGERNSLMDCLLLEEYGDGLLEVFLRSMSVTWLECAV